LHPGIDRPRIDLRPGASLLKGQHRLPERDFMRTFALPIALCLGLALAPAGAAELTVYATGSMEVPLHQLGEEFTHATGHTLKFELGTTGVVMNKLKTGKADVIVISVEAADGLQKDGRILAGTRSDVASSLFGVAVKKGATPPDISTPDAFKKAVLAARSISYPDPALGATSGVYLQKLFADMGIAEEAKKKTTVKPVGAAVAEAVAKGEIELGLTFLSEFVANPGVTIVGPFPSAIQSPTLYTAGLAKESANPDAARAFIAYVTSPNASAKLKALGVAPAH
jgi:molybdate transport system substrate-binding protein